MCEFSVVIAGFNLCGLPNKKACNATQLDDSHGRNPNSGYYQVNNCTEAEEGDKSFCSEDNIVSSYVLRGKGANLEEATDGGFKWVGNFVVARPPGQASYDPLFPDQEGGLWEAAGSLEFEFTNFTILVTKGRSLLTYVPNWKKAIEACCNPARCY